MKRVVIILFFLFLSTFLKSQIIIADSTGDINCYHSGFIYTQIDFLGSNTLSHWYFYDSTLSWIQIDTSTQSIFLNNNKYDSDTLFSDICGFFKLKVTDNSGNLLEERYFNIGCKLSILLESNIIKCNDDLGSFSAQVTGGQPFDNDINFIGDEYYDYKWFVSSDVNGLNPVLFSDSTSFINNLSSQYYALFVTDSIGCIDSTGFIYLLNPDPLEITFIDIFDVSCSGDSTGSFFISVNGGRKHDSLNPYTYFLLSGMDTIGFSYIGGNNSINFQRNSIYSSTNSTFPDSITFFNLGSDTFRLIVLDSANCMIDTIFYVSEPDPYLLFASNDELICSSDSVWIRIDSVLGGSLPFFYYWESIQTDSIFGSSSNYNCVIVDTIDNCNDTLEYVVNSLYAIDVSTNIIDVMCFSDSTGSINIDTILGGVYPYTINWGTSHLLNLPADDYILEIIDFIGCKYYDTLTIYQPSKFISNHFISHPVCHGDSNGFVIQNYQGGVSPYQIIGFNIGINDTIMNLSSGIYPYLVIDSNQCYLNDTLVIIDPLKISSDFTNYNQDLNCFNGTTNIEVLVWDYDSSYSLTWSNGDSGISTLISAGISIVNIIDNNGCKHSDTVLITQPDTFMIDDIILIDTVCNSGSSAYVELSGGTRPYVYLWSTGDIDSSIVNIQDSVIFIEVSDHCSNILVSDSISITPFNLETSLYFDDSSHVGSIEIDVSTTVGPFLFEWKNVLGEIISLTSKTDNLCEGVYFVSVVDESNGCLVEDTLVVSFYLPFGIIDSNSTTVLTDEFLWGFSPYTYLWDDGSNMIHADLCYGEHWVEVTDNKGCVKRQDFEIEKLFINITPESEIINCNLENKDFDLEASAIGGTGPYYYEWWNGSTENPINMYLNPGNFSVTVIDANNCKQDTTFVIANMISECIPNVFTPNNDGKNDTWNLDDTFLYEDTEVRIYGKYGRLLFQSFGYYEAWDGTNENGENLPNGIYFYTIDIGHGYDQIRGTVTILR